MGFSSPVGRAPERSQDARSELSPQNAPSQKSSSSFKERLKDKGQQCISRFKPGTAPGLFHLYPRELPFSRWITYPFRKTMAGTIRETSPDPSSVDAHQPNVVDATPRNGNSLEFQSTNAVQGPSSELCQCFAERGPSHSWNLELQSAASNTLSMDAESPISKTQSRKQWSDRVKGYTTSIRSVARRERRVTSAAAADLSPPGLGGDLTGVGSQYDIAKKATSHDPNMPFVHLRGAYASSRDGCKQSQEGPPSRSINSAKRSSTASNAGDAWDISSSVNSSEHNLLRRDSSFTRPSSTISSATTFESSIGRASSQYARPVSLIRKALSSSSSLSTSRGSLSLHRSQNMKSHPIPPFPVPPILDQQGNKYPSPPIQQLLPTATPPQIVNCASDQVSLDAWVAQQRRLNRLRAPEQIQGKFFIETENKQLLPRLEIGSDDEQSPEATGKPALSTIDESDAGCSNTEANSIHRRSSSDRVDDGLLCPPHLSNRDFRFSSPPATDTLTNLPSVDSVDTIDQDRTPATSLADQPASEALEPFERSDTGESMSDISDETDESLQEAFVTRSLDPALLSVAIILKDLIASLVLQRVLEWIRSCHSGEATETGNTESRGSQDVNFGSGSADGSPGRARGSKKRGLDRASNGFDRGDGEDQDKRRRTEAALTDADISRPSLFLACPFLKGHPEENWPRCQRSWPSVHRIKGHLYRNHTLPIHCERCFSEFKTEIERREHNRSDIPCKVLRPPREMLGIDQAMRDKLKCRRGLQNVSEEKRWQNMYKILFPEAQDIPSPYYETKICTEMRAQYHTVLGRELPDPIITQVNHRVRNAPEYQQLPAGLQRHLLTIIHQAVWDVFDDVLPTLPLQRGSLETPSDTISELAAVMDNPSLPTNYSSLQDVVDAQTPEVPDQSSSITTVPNQNQGERTLNTTIFYPSPALVNTSFQPLNPQWSQPQAGILEHVIPSDGLVSLPSTINADLHASEIESLMDIFNPDFNPLNFPQ